MTGGSDEAATVAFGSSLLRRRLKGKDIYVTSKVGAPETSRTSAASRLNDPTQILIEEIA